jgi:hypothetical protein
MVCLRCKEGAGIEFGRAVFGVVGVVRVVRCDRLVDVEEGVEWLLLVSCGRNVGAFGFSDDVSRGDGPSPALQHFHAGAVYVCEGWVDAKFLCRVSCVYEGDAQGVNIRSK